MDVSQKKDQFRKQDFKNTPQQHKQNPAGILYWLIKISCLDNDTYK